MSDTQVQPGGSPTPALATVTTDQQTIFGSGTSVDPLTTNGGAGQSTGRTFKATLGSSFGTPHIGQPMAITIDAPTLGIATVAKASGVSTRALAQVAGLMIANDATGVTIQYDGIVTLTTAQWDAIAGTSGGLTPTEAYFVDTAGVLDTVPPVATGNYSSQVGFALNATQLLLCTPSLPIGPHA
jgi:hypothetical protein